ncbi:SET and MYND domain-containing protein (SMYD)-like protein [Leptotrombidium deliense]|uniref:Protein-lysine N-methyltransferase SMYD4 n=1 Tax=Leptotrombidium deliense TaxID=299467 RepID=A0A443SJF1_9ACAR|nr:SET and MYND domain-containing protein (SMYD)-like protein [Leptotrombidium deliense]
MGENQEARKVLFGAQQVILSSNYFTDEMKSRMIEEVDSTATTHMEQGNDQYVDIPLLTETKIPGFSSSIQLCINEEKGRHVIVKEDIKKGTMILSEEAIGFWLTPCQYEKCCNFCMKMMAKRYVSCRDCKAVRYCSLVCEHKAWTQYHSVECPFLDILKYFSSFLTSLRFVIRYGFDAILETIDEGEKPLEYFLKNGMVDNYTFVHSLFAHDNHMPFTFAFVYCVGSLLVTRVAEDMGLIQRNSKEYCTFAAVILKQMCQININSYALLNHKLSFMPDLNILVDHGNQTRNGIGIYIGGSFFCHSCGCNCDRITIGKQLVVVANRNIKAGEEITITYGPSYKSMSFFERQAYLESHYHFKCKCNACVNKLANVMNAYRCRKCSGAVIHNSDTWTAYCVQCGRNVRDISVYYEKKTQALKDVEKAKLLLKQKNLKAVKKHLDDALTIMTRVHFSIVPQYRIHMYLLEYFSLKGDYFQMHLHCIQLALIEQELHGNDALEAASYMIKAAYLLLHHIRSTVKDSEMSIVSRARAIYSEALVIFDEIKDREINLITEDYAANFKVIPALNKMLTN